MLKTRGLRGSSTQAFSLLIPVLYPRPLFCWVCSRLGAGEHLLRCFWTGSGGKNLLRVYLLEHCNPEKWVRILPWSAPAASACPLPLHPGLEGWASLFLKPHFCRLSLSACCQRLKFSVKAKDLISKLIISFLALYKVQFRGICQGTEVREVSFDTQSWAMCSWSFSSSCPHWKNNPHGSAVEMDTCKGLWWTASTEHF